MNSEAAPTDIGWMRWEVSWTGFGRAHITDCRDRYFCRHCDAPLPRWALFCRDHRWRPVLRFRQRRLSNAQRRGDCQ